MKLARLSNQTDDHRISGDNLDIMRHLLLLQLDIRLTVVLLLW